MGGVVLRIPVTLVRAHKVVVRASTIEAGSAVVSIARGHLPNSALEPCSVH